MSYEHPVPMWALITKIHNYIEWGLPGHPISWRMLSGYVYNTRCLVLYVNHDVDLVRQWVKDEMYLQREREKNNDRL